MLNTYLPPDFDWEFYLESNPDLRANGINTPREAAKHYIEFGKNENRIYNKNHSYSNTNSGQNVKHKNKIETFEKICEKYLSFLPNVFPRITKYSNKKSLIVETRWNKSIEFTIKNTIRMLGNDWGHIIACNNENVNEIYNLVKTISDQIEIINLGDLKIDRNSYNNLMFDLSFWEKIDCEKILIYQYDTFIFKKFDEKFLEWDYIGAPWPSEHSDNLNRDFELTKKIQVGNGGLSLRSVSAIKKILQNNQIPKRLTHDRNEPTHIYEDAFYSEKIECDENYKLAPIEVAEKFSFEHIFKDNTFGCHQPFVHSSDSFLFEKFLKRINGVNVLGYGNKVSGLGHNMRTIVSVLKKLKIPHNVNIIETNKTTTKLLENDEHCFFNTNLILCNPETNLNAYVGEDYLHNKYNIALWAWELEKLPNSWKKKSELFDEIWTISDFCKKTFEQELIGKKIEKINIPSNFFENKNKETSKKVFNLDGKFVCLFVFDAHSDIDRKNPFAVIESFKKSLGKLQNTILIIKGQNLSPKEYNLLKGVSENNIIIINDTFSKEKMETLFNCADVYISLHRSEGSGLTIMEAINLEIPVITTNYSGNLDFCDENCILVDFKHIPLHSKHPAYTELVNLATWAEPDVNDASEKLFDLYNDYENYKNKILITKKKMLTKFSFNNLYQFFSKKFLKSERDRSPYFFIHVYKNLGTTIHKQLPENYNRRFYYQKNFRVWERDNDQFLNVDKFFSKDEILSIDHIKIDELFDLGIIDEIDVENRKFLGIVREPIDRFLSICNFNNITPNELIRTFKYKTHTQTSFFLTKLPIDLTLILMEEKNLITDWFKNFGVEIDLNKHFNVSERKYSRSDLSNEQIDKIKHLFFDDFILYEKLKKSSGCLKMNGFKL
jgi:hypothetical protein